MAHTGKGNKATALEHINIAISREPNNYEYSRLKDYLEGGGDWYSGMSNMYGYDFGDLNMGFGSRFCCEMIALNLFCNCCSPFRC